MKKEYDKFLGESRKAIKEVKPKFEEERKRGTLKKLGCALAPFALVGGIWGANSYWDYRQWNDLQERGYRKTALTEIAGPQEREGIYQAMIFDREAEFSGLPEDFERTLGELYREVRDLKLSMTSKGDYTPLMEKIEDLTALLNAYGPSHPERAQEWLKQNPLFLDPLKYIENRGLNVMGTRIIYRHDTNINQDRGIFDIILENGRMERRVLSTSPEDWYWNGEELVEGVLPKR